jgi:hypothetical protein
MDMHSIALLNPMSSLPGDEKSTGTDDFRLMAQTSHHDYLSINLASRTCDNYGEMLEDGIAGSELAQASSNDQRAMYSLTPYPAEVHR